MDQQIGEMFDIGSQPTTTKSALESANLALESADSSIDSNVVKKSACVYRAQVSLTRQNDAGLPFSTLRKLDGESVLLSTYH